MMTSRDRRLPFTGGSSVAAGKTAADIRRRWGIYVCYLELFDTASEAAAHSVNRRSVALVLLLGICAPLPGIAQSGSRATMAILPTPNRIVLERAHEDWCFHEIRARVDLTAPVDRRVGMRVRLEATPRGFVEVPGIVVARPWASFVIRGENAGRIPPPGTPHVITVTVTAEANGGTASQRVDLYAGPRARESCRARLEAEDRQRLLDANRALQESENEKDQRDRERAESPR